jgi:hypothetical protein
MLTGTCHCQALRWRFEGLIESATACNCTVCRRYGALWAYDFEGEGIHVEGPSTAYVRGRAIEFHFCPDRRRRRGRKLRDGDTVALGGEADDIQ